MLAGPDPGSARAGRLAGPAFQHQVAGRGVLACRLAGQGVQLEGLVPVGARFAEGDPVGQGFEVGPVEVDLELIARLGVEARLGMQAVDIGIDVHDEHGAALAGEHVQVVDEQLAGLSRQRRVEMMGHGDSPFVPVMRGQGRYRSSDGADVGP